ncbi:hypothetical protein B0T21DRAFT_348999 [Apiosordaria backusii]|uniref:Uncharacterized protein n=1 Tax=Apiosordaria backusii TaxID=314023 RepID=A0AA40BJT3_9PEZI|nr:hypothetical protein B0T21DRAFT_348999 [Apiosordaria backusii]
MTDRVIATFQKQCAVVPGNTNGWILPGKPVRDSCNKAGTSSKEERSRAFGGCRSGARNGQGCIAVMVMEAAKIHGMAATGADNRRLQQSGHKSGWQWSSHSSQNPKLYVCTSMHDPPPPRTPYCTKRIASSLACPPPP